jgi:hypothetical protein
VLKILSKSKSLKIHELNIFARIFRHSIVYLDLKDLLELEELKDLGFKDFKDLEYSKKIPR